MSSPTKDKTKSESNGGEKSTDDESDAVPTGFSGGFSVKISDGPKSKAGSEKLDKDAIEDLTEKITKELKDDDTQLTRIEGKSIKNIEDQKSEKRGQELFPEAYSNLIKDRLDEPEQSSAESSEAVSDDTTKDDSISEQTQRDIIIDTKTPTNKFSKDFVTQLKNDRTEEIERKQKEIEKAKLQEQLQKKKEEEHIKKIKLQVMPETKLNQSNIDKFPSTMSEFFGLKKEGLSLQRTAIFVSGQIASGFIYLPKALVGTGWSGIVVMIWCCVNSLYAGICLGRCWLILEERWVEYKHANFRYPYPAIALRAVGPKMRNIVSFCIDFTLFGVAVVYLLISSQLISKLASRLGISFCYWVLILAAILCPLMWFGYPNDFWFIAVFALITVFGTSILIIVGVTLVYVDHPKSYTVTYPSPSFLSFFLSFGTITFAFGGSATFPTYQNDMKRRNKFPLAAVIAFIIVMIIYLPVTLCSYAMLGKALDSNIIESLPQTALKAVVEVIFGIHLLMVFLMTINPPSQEMEELLNIPKNFGWKRCVARLVILLAIIFVAQTLPKFDKILNLVGGSTVTLMTFVFPPLFYMLLCKDTTNPEWPERFVPAHEKAFLIQIMVVGIIGGIFATYAAITEIGNNEAMNFPCYVNLTEASRNHGT